MTDVPPHQPADGTPSPAAQGGAGKCNQCGFSIPNSSKFCPECGAVQPVSTLSTSSEPLIPAGQPGGSMATALHTSPTLEKKKGRLLLGCVVVVVIVAAFLGIRGWTGSGGSSSWKAAATSVCNKYDEKLDLESTSLSEDAQSIERFANDMTSLGVPDNMRRDVSDLLADLDRLAELDSDMADSIDSEDIDQMLDSLDSLEEAGKIEDRWSKWFREEQMNECRNVFYREKDDL